MSTAYKVDERVLRNIINSNVSCINKDTKIQLITYYNSRKVSNLIMSNSEKVGSKLKHANVVYKFKCPNVDCRLRNMSYIGMTTTTLSRRITMHLQDGAIKQHFDNVHPREITRKILTENTEIMTVCNDRRRLPILEALYIREYSPALNKQVKSCLMLALFV